MFAEATRVVEDGIHMKHHDAEIIGASPAFKEVVRQVEVVAPTNATVLLGHECEPDTPLVGTECEPKTTLVCEPE
jgi:transcriptional regulator with GAF, ATPase, and Fis domain